MATNNIKNLNVKRIEDITKLAKMRKENGNLQKYADKMLFYASWCCINGNVEFSSLNSLYDLLSNCVDSEKRENQLIDAIKQHKKGRNRYSNNHLAKMLEITKEEEKNMKVLFTSSKTKQKTNLKDDLDIVKTVRNLYRENNNISLTARTTGISRHHVEKYVRDIREQEEINKAKELLRKEKGFEI